MLGHPRGLSTLFFTEMWERFSYYGMRALLLLFMVAPIAGGGLGFTTRRAATIYGLYTMAVYASSIPGGWLADRVLGHYRSVLCGGTLITLGHFSMAIPTLPTFFLGLALIVLGTGMLKPNVSTMVGFLYKPDDARRDAGFSLFYMGINLGAMTAPIVCGFLGQKLNWHFGFGAAGVGMLIGVTQYILGRKHLPESTPARERAIDDVANEPLTPSDWRRIGAICVLFLFALIFWSVFEQAGSTLTLFADHTHAPLHPRLDVSVELVPIRAAAFRDHARARLRLVLDAPRQTRTVERDEIHGRPGADGDRISNPHPRRAHSRNAAHSREPNLAHAPLLRAHARRALCQSRRPQPGDEDLAEESGRPDDGLLVPGRIPRQLLRGLDRQLRGPVPALPHLHDRFPAPRRGRDRVGDVDPAAAEFVGEVRRGTDFTTETQRTLRNPSL
jgi:hypothetical protein